MIYTVFCSDYVSVLYRTVGVLYIEIKKTVSTQCETDGCMDGQTELP